MTTSQQQGFPNIAAPIADAGTGLIQYVWLQFLRSLWNRTGSQQGGSGFSTGDMKSFAGSSDQDGWLDCNGDAISRLNFANLFGIIGTTWGIGDGATTFNLPDFRNRVFLGTSFLNPVGTYGGSSTSTLGVANLPAHSHGINDPGHHHLITDPGHTHSGGTPSSTNTAGASPGAITGAATGSSVTGITINSATTGITTQDTGSGTPFPILPPYGATRVLIKT